MRKFIYGLFVGFSFLLGSGSSLANGTKGVSTSPLKLDYAAFTVSRIFCNRDLLVPEIGCADWRGRVEMDMDFKLLDTVFMRNNVHGEGTDGAFKTMGWKFELGLELTDYLEIGWSHHSRHVFDQGTPHVFSHDWEVLLQDKFPVYDAAFLRLVLIPRK